MSFQVGEMIALKIAQLIEGTVFPLGQNHYGTIINMTKVII